MKFINKIPIPIAGLALGSVALGNLLATYSSLLQLFFSLISLIIIILLTIKFFITPKILKSEFTNPLIATVFSTFPMSIILLSTYFKKYFGSPMSVIWLFGIVLDIFVLCFVVSNFLIKKQNLKFIFPTWFITFVGPAVVTVTAISYNLEILGKIFFWFSFINYIILIPFVLYRVYVYKKLNVSALPTLTIFSAPGGLLLASYVIGITNKSELVIKILLILCFIFYMFVLIQLPLLLNREFYPSYSAFTFPLVICGMAFQKTYNYYYNTENNSLILKIGVYFSEALATIIVIYVLYSFIKHIFKFGK
ncbi:TDT family transporter [Gemella bergeri]|nr:TDT family transporter [Gemella bergeri]